MTTQVATFVQPFDGGAALAMAMLIAVGFGASTASSGRRIQRREVIHAIGVKP